jgi:hypothetical protein
MCNFSDKDCVSGSSKDQSGYTLKTGLTHWSFDFPQVLCSVRQVSVYYDCGVKRVHIFRHAASVGGSTVMIVDLTWLL